MIDQEAEQSIIIFQTGGDEAAYLRDQYLGNHPHYPSAKRRIGLSDFDALIESRPAVVYPIQTWYSCSRRNMPDDERAEIHRQLMRKYHVVSPTVKQAVEGGKAVDGALYHVADLSGGSVFCLKTPLLVYRFPYLHPRVFEAPVDPLGEASSVYSQILAKMNQRHVIGYYPTNRAQDGKRRKVEIQVRDHPEYTIESRRYYYAPNETSPQK